MTGAEGVGPGRGGTDPTPGPRWHPKYDLPCRYYLAELGSYCGSKPTRRYLNGQFCVDHQPARTAVPRPGSSSSPRP